MGSRRRARPTPRVFAYLETSFLGGPEMTRRTKSKELGRNITRTALLALMLGVPYAAAQIQALPVAPVQQAWVARFNGTGSYWDEAHDLALGDGCIYVTGFAYTDW